MRASYVLLLEEAQLSMPSRVPHVLLQNVQQLSHPHWLHEALVHAVRNERLEITRHCVASEADDCAFES